MKYETLPDRVRRVVDRCRSGEVLCLTKRAKATGELEELFYFHPSNRKAGPASSRVAIREGFLVPQNDGLFEADNSQTWRAA